jgi:hypothetical protein
MSVISVSSQFWTLVKWETIKKKKKIEKQRKRKKEKGKTGNSTHHIEAAKSVGCPTWRNTAKCTRSIESC